MTDDGQRTDGDEEPEEEEEEEEQEEEDSSSCESSSESDGEGPGRPQILDNQPLTLLDDENILALPPEDDLFGPEDGEDDDYEEEVSNATKSELLPSGDAKSATANSFFIGGLKEAMPVEPETETAPGSAGDKKKTKKKKKRK